MTIRAEGKYYGKLSKCRQDCLGEIYEGTPRKGKYIHVLSLNILSTGF